MANKLYKTIPMAIWRFFVDAVWGSSDVNPELMKAMTKLQASREFPLLLSYAFLLTEDTVFHKDGAFMAVYEYLPRDVDSSTGDMMDASCQAIQGALNKLTDGWLVQWDLVSEEDSKYYEPVRYDNVVAALVDDARRFNFEKSDTVYRSRYLISITYKPSDMVAKKFSTWLRGEDGSQSARLDKERYHFESTLLTFFAQFSKITTVSTELGDERVIPDEIQRLSGDKLVTFLKFCITGDPKPLRAPNCGYMLDYYLTTTPFVGGLTPKIGNKYIKTLHIDDLPEDTWPAVLDELNYMGFEYRWSSKFIALSTGSAKKELKKIKRSWSSQAIGALGVLKQSMNLHVELDEAAELKKYQTQNAITENDSGTTRYGFYTSVIVLMHENEERLQEMAEHVIKVMEGEKFKIRDEEINSNEAYLGSLPGHGAYNIRKPIIDNIYLSHAIPASGVWSGSRTFPHPRMPGKQPALVYAKTRDTRVFRFNNCVSDIMHMLIIGPTGSGKSTLLALLGYAWQKYPNARVVILDKDDSNAAWVLASGGEVMNIAHAVYAPFAELMKHPENSSEFAEELNWALQWIENVLSLENVTLDAKAKKQVREELIGKYRSHYKLGTGLSVDDLDFQIPEIRDTWKEFIDSTGGMLSGTEDQFSQNRKLCLSMDTILEMGESKMIPMLDFIFHRLDKIFKEADFTLFGLEEFWQYLYHPIFLKKLRDWLKTLRKFNVSVVPATQNINDVANVPELFSELTQSCPVTIFLPNEHLMKPNIRDIYAQFGLNDQQMNIIQMALPKRQYYITSLEGNRLVDFDLSPLELAFMGVSGKDYKNNFSKIYDKDNPEWVLDYLEEKRLFDWKEYAQEAYFNTPKKQQELAHA